MFVKYSGPQMVVSPMTVYDVALPLSKVQAFRYSNLPRFSAGYLTGSAHTSVSRRAKLKVERDGYQQRTISMSTPIVYQTRRTAAPCKGSIVGVLSDSYRRAVEMRCSNKSYEC